MMMVASSVVLTVVVLNYHHRTAETHVMPMWVRSVFLQWLPWILRMDRPREKITRKTIMMSNRLKELELKENDSKSLMANVLDMDDDFRWFLQRPNKITEQFPPGLKAYLWDAIEGMGWDLSTGMGWLVLKRIVGTTRAVATSTDGATFHQQSLLVIIL